MTELEDALGGLQQATEVAREIARHWESQGPDENLNGWWSAWLLHGDYPNSTADELLAVSRASGVIPTALELEGWEQFWIELGLDSKSEVEQTAEEEEGGWHQPPLPGLEGV